MQTFPEVKFVGLKQWSQGPDNGSRNRAVGADQRGIGANCLYNFTARKECLACVENIAPARGTPYLETRLLFGTERPDGGPAVTDEQFMTFVDREVTPGFPDGLTVQEGRGQWRDAGGTIEKERSYELILLYPPASAAESDRRIEEIRGDYREEFAQEAVARVDDRKRVDF